MVEKISTLDVRKRLGDLLNRVALRHDEFVIERKGRPLAALVPVGRVRELKEWARLKLLEAMKSSPGTLTVAEANALADKAKHATRPRRKSRGAR